MVPTHHNPEAQRLYRDKAAEIAATREQITQQLERSKETGDVTPAQKLLDELRQRTKEFGELRSSLGPAGIFLATHGFEIVNDHTVSFIIPKGSSRRAILTQAEELYGEGSRTVSSYGIIRWREEEVFAREAVQAEKICIDGRVSGSENKSFDEQVVLLAGRGLEMAPIEDVMVASALLLVATGELLFGWTDREKREGKQARVAGGRALAFYKSGGLNVNPISRSLKHEFVAAAARINLDEALQRL